MDYPRWVNEPADQSPDELRHKRVTYMFRRAALALGNSTGLRPLSEHLGINHVKVCVMAQRGIVPKDVALEIELLVGRDIAPWQLLTDPLNGHTQAVSTLDDDEL